MPLIMCVVTPEEPSTSTDVDTIDNSGELIADDALRPLIAAWLLSFKSPHTVPPTLHVWQASGRYQMTLRLNHRLSPGKQPHYVGQWKEPCVRHSVQTGWGGRGCVQVLTS